MNFIRFFTKLTLFSLYTALVITFTQFSTPEHITATTIISNKVAEFPPILQKICKAESSNRQFKENGRVVRGKINPSDIGICQINEPIWNDRAIELGYNIYTEEGNKAMALYIFNNYGTDPWNSSKANWKN